MSRTRVHRTTAKLAAILLTVCTVISISAVDAFWGKSVISRHPRLSTDRMIPALLVRGGSESASAWNAGSRYDYRSPKSSLLNRSKPIRQQSYDIREDTKEAIATAFLNRDDRNRFIARVYALLSGQLLFTAATIHAFHTNPNIREFIMYTNTGRKIPMIGLLISSIALVLSTMSGIGQSSWRWPIFLAFTIGQALPIGFISSLYAYATVIKAMTTTAAVTGGITLYTVLQKNPKYDLSQWGRALSGLGMAFLMYGAIHVLELFGILPRGFLPYSEAIYCIVGAGLFSLYLAHHTRLIVAGKSAKYRMNEKDYILGAMTLYSDIVDVFLYLLRVLGEIDDN